MGCLQCPALGTEDDPGSKHDNACISSSSQGFRFPVTANFSQEIIGEPVALFCMNIQGVINSDGGVGDENFRFDFCLKDRICDLTCCFNTATINFVPVIFGPSF